jgi:hypothetical protein
MVMHISITVRPHDGEAQWLWTVEKSDGGYKDGMVGSWGEAVKAIEDYCDPANYKPD